MDAARRTPHPNVLLGLVTTLVFTTRGSLSTAFDAYVLLLPDGTNLRVGIMESISGIASLLLTLVSGVLADRIGRRRVLRAAGLASILSSAATLTTVFCLAPSRPSLVYAGLCVASGTVGLARGCFMPPFEAIFGDSTAGAARAKWYTRKAACYTFGLAFGPALTMVIFAAARNDTWTQPELSAVLCAAAAIGVVLAALVLGFREVEAPPSQLLDPAAGDAESAAAPLNATPAAPPPPRWRCVRRKHVPILISISSLLGGLGSGMAYKFIPMFCWKELGLSPIPTHAIIVAQQLAATVLNFAIGRLARWIGPIGAVVLFIGGGVAALGAVCVEATPRAVVVGLLILRGALMNSTAGLTGAVLNDHVEKRHRAKWNMSAQFRQVTWSGSAFAGGALIDAIGYRKTFLFTCGFHAAMGLVLLPLVAVVPRGGGRGAA